MDEGHGRGAQQPTVVDEVAAGDAVLGRDKPHAPVADRDGCGDVGVRQVGVDDGRAQPPDAVPQGAQRGAQAVCGSGLR